MIWLVEYYDIKSDAYKVIRFVAFGEGGARLLVRAATWILGKLGQVRPVMGIRPK
jgi:hypothetical protein